MWPFRFIVQNVCISRRLWLLNTVNSTYNDIAFNNILHKTMMMPRSRHLVPSHHIVTLCLKQYRIQRYFNYNEAFSFCSVIKIKNGLWWLTLMSCVQKLAETIGIKSTESKRKYGQLSACQVSRCYSKVRSVAFYLKASSTFIVVIRLYFLYILTQSFMCFIYLILCNHDHC
jgi:hypothetical protein